LRQNQQFHPVIETRAIGTIFIIGLSLSLSLSLLRAQREAYLKTKTGYRIFD